MKTLGIICGMLFLPVMLYAQDYVQANQPHAEAGKVSEFSSMDIELQDVMYKKRVIRRVDLREKINRPFFTQDKRITEVILDAFLSGKIKGYRNDSLWKGTEIDKEYVEDKLQATPSLRDPEEIKNLKQQIQKAKDAGDQMDVDYYTQELQDYKANNPEGQDYLPREICMLDIHEDVLFDKKRSRLYYDIIAITIVIPAEYNTQKGVDVEVGTFAYKDLKDVFREDERAVWFNRQNDVEHKNFVEAIQLRLFDGYLTYVSNPEKQMIIDKYGGDPKQGRLGSTKEEMKLMEKEHNLWSY